MFHRHYQIPDEIEEEISSWDDDKIIEDVEVAIIPPPVDELTDEEDINDEEILEVCNVQGFAGSLELIGYENSLENVETASSGSIPKPAKHKKSDPSSFPMWEKCSPNYKQEMRETSKDRYDKLEALQGKSTVQIFEQFFNSDLLDYIVDQSLIYANQKNDPNFSFNVNELKIFLGILLFSGYHRVALQSMYWEREPDAGIPLVYNSMTRQRFKEIMQYLHLNDNSKIDKNDKMYKLRPYLNALNKYFMTFGIFDSQLSIDKMMLRYKGMHSTKLVMKGLPIKLGYKFWCLCAANGYLYYCIPYLGKENQDSIESLANNVVQNLVSVIPKEEAANHEIFLNKFFTSLDVLKVLGDKNLKLTGVIRENHIKKCPFMSSKETEKTTEQGHVDYQFDHNSKVLVAKWYNSADVYVATNYSTLFPTSDTTRYSLKQEKKIPIQIPKLIFDYNQSAGGVDMLDEYVCMYRTSVRGKKWWFPIFTQMIDIAVVNTWRLHNLVNKHDPITLLDTRRRIVSAYLSKRAASNYNHQGPQKSKPLRGRVSEAIRYDRGNHLVKPIPTQRRCALCGKKTKRICTRCEIPLHDVCFENFHTK